MEHGQFRPLQVRRSRPQDGVNDTSLRFSTQRQCPFCAFVNVVMTGDEFCLNCGLDLARLNRPAPAPTVPAAVMSAAPVAAPKARRGRKALKAERAGMLSASQDVVSPVTPAAQAHHPQPLAVPALVPIEPPPWEPVASAPALEHHEAIDDATIAAPVASPTRWRLELEDGTSVTLPSDDVVIGRRPVAVDTATPVTLPDPTRTLSRVHARLRRDASRDIWTIEDLGSSNGIALVTPAGKATFLVPRRPVAATETLLIGTMTTRLLSA